MASLLLEAAGDLFEELTFTIILIHLLGTGRRRPVLGIKTAVLVEEGIAQW